mmetsp:Transcript_69999/g.205252  ORF Transcript_69999/g.205252 Transcript_69999/m.205252 type:complete len:322 (-) Transcript_69999:41-1006(-)
MPGSAAPPPPADGRSRGLGGVGRVGGVRLGDDHGRDGRVRGVRGVGDGGGQLDVGLRQPLLGQVVQALGLRLRLGVLGGLLLLGLLGLLRGLGRLLLGLLLLLGRGLLRGLLLRLGAILGLLLLLGGVLLGGLLLLLGLLGLLRRHALDLRVAELRPELLAELAGLEALAVVVGVVGHAGDHGGGQVLAAARAPALQDVLAADGVHVLGDVLLGAVAALHDGVHHRAAGLLEGPRGGGALLELRAGGGRRVALGEHLGLGGPLVLDLDEGVRDHAGLHVRLHGEERGAALIADGRNLDREEGDDGRALHRVWLGGDRQGKV